MDGLPNTTDHIDSFVTHMNQTSPKQTYQQNQQDTVFLFSHFIHIENEMLTYAVRNTHIPENKLVILLSFFSGFMYTLQQLCTTNTHSHT